MFLSSLSFSVRSEQKNSSDLIQSKRFSIGPTRTDAQADLDSDEEICRLMAAQDSSHHALQQEAEESPLEVVGLEYSVKSGRKGKETPEAPVRCLSDCDVFVDEKTLIPGDEDEYDSADTDELIASRRNLSPLSNERSKGRSQPGEEKVKAVLPLQTLSFKEDSGLEKKRTKTRVLPVLQHGDEEEEEEEESAGSSSDSEYEAMFSNVTRLELSLADLQRLAEEDSQAAGILGSEGDPALATGPSERPAPKKGTSPEEILAAILEDSDDDRPRKRKKRKGVTLPPLPAFQGTRSLQETDDLLRREEEEGGGDQMDSRTTETEGQEGEKNGALSQSPVASESSSSSEEDEEERTTEKPAAEALLPSQIFSDEGSGEAAPPTLRRKLNAEEEEELQRKANLRRLSALQQRQRKAEEQKKLIQGALANLVSGPPQSFTFT